MGRSHAWEPLDQTSERAQIARKHFMGWVRIDAKPQNMISEGLKILAFLQLKLRWPANPGQGPEGAVAQRRIACRALSGTGLAAQYLST